MFAWALIVSGALLLDQGSSKVKCSIEHELAFKVVEGQFHIKDDSRPVKDRIVLRVPIDCVSKRPLVPRDDEIVLWIDLALPMAFKVAALRGSYMNPSAFGSYAASAEADVDDFLSKKWKLDDRDVCSDIRKVDGFPETTCFVHMLEKWRLAYKDQ